ncbi:HNH endonuclease signature motif containing protein [Mycobacterium sp. TY815]|uniref:HNH endonuclease signature motif containing protein n=1 Tax=Mycobacterium sp. TY815 TaxID=3050581 RepID=UPI002742714C|nr:HNH endonuclease signature motif containing protein [Mycobacterium sp. TY815]MDP7703248.1 HNH endonuclease signature motif containing protein [Mycobacterium sp. TY815]
MGFPYPRFIGQHQRDLIAKKSQPDDNGCWIWTGFLCSGYPHMNVAGRVVGAHRVSWVLHHNKEIPEGYEVDHVCKNNLCVNPEHLEAVTRRENLRRRHGPAHLPPAPDEKECRRCHRLGERGFRWEAHHWYCKNERTCQARIDRAATAKVIVPTSTRCANCGHMKRRHNPLSPDQMAVSSLPAHCHVINCACSGWQQ